MHVAVVDIGSISVHGLVVRIDGDLRCHVIDRVKELARLGESVARGGRLDEDTTERAIRAVTAVRRLAERRGVQRILAVATNAVRVAENGDAFLQEVHARTGIHVRLISGSEEARLVWRAVLEEHARDDDPLLVVDLGGGSADFAMGTGRLLHWTESLDLGVQGLRARFLPDGEATPDRLRDVEQHVRASLRPVTERLARRAPRRVVVTAGSAAAVLRVLRAAGSADHDALPLKAVVELERELATLPREKRLLLPGVEAERADLVVPAVTFFRVLCELIGVDELEVSEAGIREGLVREFIDAHGPEIQWELTEPNARRRAVLQLAERLGYDALHAHHVARLTVTLFDETRQVHGLDEGARELLEYAAFLHDVGYVVNEKSHHRHTEYLVLHGLNGGFAEREVRIIAAIGRYHRKASPKGSHENFRSLAEEDRDLVRRAAAILRIADALDRSHTRCVGGLTAAAGDGALTVTVQAEGPADVELGAARRKASLFEEVFGLRVEVGLADRATEDSAR